MKRYERVDLYNIVSKNRKDMIAFLRNEIDKKFNDMKLNSVSSENLIDIVSKMARDGEQQENEKSNERSDEFKEKFGNFCERMLTGRIDDTLWFIILEVHFEIVNIKLNQVQELLRIILTAGMEYFFGKWRNEYKRRYGNPPGPPLFTYEETRRLINWRSQFRSTLIAALLLNDDSLTKKLLSWIDHDLYNVRSREVREDPTDIEYYMLLRCVYCDETLDNEIELKQSIRNQKLCKRNKMLLDCLEMIQERNAKQFTKCFIRYIKHDRKHNFLFSTPDSPRSPAALVDLDSTIIWNLAQRKIEHLAELPEDFMDYIITPATLHLQ